MHVTMKPKVLYNQNPKHQFPFPCSKNTFTACFRTLSTLLKYILPIVMRDTNSLLCIHYFQKLNGREHYLDCIFYKHEQPESKSFIIIIFNSLHLNPYNLLNPRNNATSIIYRQWGVHSPWVKTILLPVQVFSDTHKL